MPNPDVYLRSLAPPSDVLLSESAAASTGGGVTGTATFSQAAATWESTATEQFDATVAFLQAPAAWDATGSEEIAGSATFEQAAATWTASDQQAVTGTGAWEQGAAAWDASATSVYDVPAPSPGGSRFREVWRRPPSPIHLQASFVQRPASWRAEMRVDNSPAYERMDEEAFLALV